MHYLLSYWLLVIRLGIERAEKKEFIVTFGLLVVAPIITVIFGFGFQFTAMQWAWAVIGAMGFDLLVVIPSRIGVRYLRSITPILVLSVDEPREGYDTYSLWHRVAVLNPTANAVEGCYGLTKTFEQLFPKYIASPSRRFPAPGHRLPWAKGGSEGGERYTQTILGNNNVAYLDLVHTNRPDETRLRIPSPSREGKMPEMDAYQLEPGLYEMTIEVGGRGCAPSRIRLRVRYGGGQDVEIQELR